MISVSERRPAIKAVPSNKRMAWHIGVKLKKLRVYWGFNRHEVAQAIGMVHNGYNRYEKGDGCPSIRVLFKLAALYDVPVEKLLPKDWNGTGRVAKVKLKPRKQKVS